MLFLTNINLNKNELQNAVLQPLAAPPVDPKLGQIYCDSVSSKIKWFNGVSWRIVGVIVESSSYNGSIVVDGVEMSVYNLPVATDSTLGGVKVGTGLNIDVNGVLTSDVDWSQVKNRPTSVSEFINDEEFIDNTVSNLANYYLKSQVYTKDEIASLISLTRFEILVVEELPESGQNSNTIYLVPKGGSIPSDSYDEYLWVISSSKYEHIGSTAIDLTNYLQKDGDTSNTTVAFNVHSSRELPTSGEATSIITGKIVKYLQSLSNVAFTGNYSDLLGKPGIISYYDLTISQKLTSYTALGPVLGILIKDSVTNEMVLADIDITSGNVITINCSKIPTNNLIARISYIGV